MKPIITLIALFFIQTGSTYAQAPVLLFSDMENGPKSGWSTAQPNRGAAITIWGRQLGNARGESYVTVNGVNLTTDSDYALWGEYWPTPFYQRITFWLNSNMADGPGTITVTVNGQTSNTLPFTIRQGRIFFVSNGANGDGSLQSPFKNSTLTKYGTLQYGLDAGDILYYRDATYTEGQLGANGLIRIAYVDSSREVPFAMLAYPGEKPKVEITGDYAMAFRNQADGVVISGFVSDTKIQAVSMSSWGRFIGNDVTAMKSTSTSGTAGITTSGDGNVILGNAIHGGRSGWRLDHATYFSGCATVEGSQLGWNYVYDNDFGRGPELSVNHQQERCETGVQVLKSHFIFNNIVDCLPQRAVATNIYDLSYNDGEEEPGPIFIYNNVFTNCGTLDLEDTMNVGWAPVVTINTERGHSRFYHNVFYNGNYVGLNISYNDQVNPNSNALSTYFRNNIVVMNSSGILGDSRAHQYVINNGDPTVTSISDNLFYDMGANEMNLNDLDLATNTEGLNPLFTDAENLDFSLQADSTAINAGATDLVLDADPAFPSYAPISRDMFGNLRDGQPDLGALEFMGIFSDGFESALSRGGI